MALGDERTLASDEEFNRIAHELHDGERIEAAVTIRAPAATLYEFWRDPLNLPRFMNTLEATEILDDRRSRWRWRTLGGLRFEWETEVIAQIPERMIGWRTLPGSDVHQAGSVWFKPACQDGATEVRFIVMYRPPGGKIAAALGNTLAALFGEEPADVIRRDLARLRQLFEAREIPTTDGQPHGERGLLH